MHPEQRQADFSTTSQWSTVIVVAGLVIVSALGNFFVPQMLWGMGGRESEILTLSGFGLLIAQACLLAIWCAMGDQKLILRVPLTTGILLGLFFAFWLAIRTVEDRNNIPLEVPIIIFGAMIVLVALIQIPLVIFRNTNGWVLGKAIPLKTNSHQFGIRHLLIVTTIVAVLVPIAQSSLSGGQLQGGAPWGQIVPFFFVFIVFTALVTFLCLGSVFASRKRIWNGLLLAGAVLFGPTLVTIVLNSVFKLPTGSRFISNTLAFTISLSMAIVAVLLLFYILGYRLRPAKSNVIANENATAIDEGESLPFSQS